ncbi:MAG: DUF4199 domain-containing protein [Bacteroidia bacterium]|nr:DUF4199 domain-containing protein [Bacteroidia bacterium]
MQNPVIKYGLIAGIISILLQAVLYIMGVQFMATWWVGIIMILFIIVLYVVIAIRLRKDMGGFITFKQAFTKILLIWIIGGALNLVFSLLLYHVIDPELPQKMQDAITEKTISFMERMGTPQEKIDEVTEEMQESGNKFTALSLITNYLWGILIGAILALILGASIKKNPSPFDQTQNNVQQ